MGMKIDGAIVDIGSFSLTDLIRTAYEVKDYQISGPDWLGSMLSAQRFNVQATIPEGATEKQVPQMLQALLAERFKLVVHRETKEHSVYALVVAKGGSKLKEAEPEPAAASAAADPEPEPKKGETVMGQGSNQVRVSGTMDGGKGITVKGGPMGQTHMSMVDGRLHIEADRMTMTLLVETITRFLDRPVVDMTEASPVRYACLAGPLDGRPEECCEVCRNGSYDGRAGRRRRQSFLGSAVRSFAGSSLFSSMQQMGLKLEARKAPLTVIVIDHLEKSPTEN